MSRWVATRADLASAPNGGEQAGFHSVEIVPLTGTAGAGLTDKDA